MGRRALWLRWVALVSLGELVGFVVPAVMGVRTAELSSPVQLASLPAAGVFEGALLGLAQALVLRGRLPGFRPVAWVVATSLGAAVAWFLGMLPSTTHDAWSTWATSWVVVAAVLVGTALLCTIGVAQALVLPRGTPRAFTWVGWTAAGWCAGLTAFGLVAPPLWHEGQSVPYGVLVGLAGAVAMAVTMAAVTGLGMLRLVARAASPAPRPAMSSGSSR